MPTPPTPPEPSGGPPEAVILTKRGFDNTVRRWLGHFRSPERPVVTTVAYEDLVDRDTLETSLIVFSDIERLSPAELAFAAAVHDHTVATAPGVAILNDPSHTLGRFDMLAAVGHQLGNRTRAYRLTQTTHPERFPVFLRYENDHTGAIGGILDDQAELDRAIVAAALKGHDLHSLLIVEFVDTSIDGIFTKYSTYVVGDAIFGRSVNKSTHWVVKAPRGDRDETIERISFAHVTQTPHVEKLREVFDVAGIGYGRVDYSLFDDEPVVWEINTNPYIFAEPGPDYDVISELEDTFAANLDSAFDAVIASASPAAIDLRAIPESVRSAARANPASYQPSRIKLWGRRNKSRLQPVVDVAVGVSTPIHPWIVRRVTGT